MFTVSVVFVWLVSAFVFLRALDCGYPEGASDWLGTICIFLLGPVSLCILIVFLAVFLFAKLWKLAWKHTSWIHTFFLWASS